MKRGIDRREFLKLAGIGGVVFISGIDSFASDQGKKGSQDDFFFVQLSDTHWGFSDAKINPDYTVTLKKAIASV
ncbi:MAG TPA: twin-arginine translocation signal domain-containing protein, partial [Thermodesulfovibrionales bacterium]|nr:twin-arginine translocation signal domain-containing protein [Thermodesulfovibrionales bacterium]